jgi:hypothetical protein
LVVERGVGLRFRVAEVVLVAANGCGPESGTPLIVVRPHGAPAPVLGPPGTSPVPAARSRWRRRRHVGTAYAYRACQCALMWDDGVGSGVGVAIQRYAAALPVLEHHGLVPGPGGFDPADLYAVAGHRGWLAYAEPGTGTGPSRRWRASVMAHRGETSSPVAVLVGGTIGHGQTEAEALAVALAGMLRRGDVG